MGKIAPEKKLATLNIEYQSFYRFRRVCQIRGLTIRTQLAKVLDAWVEKNLKSISSEDLFKGLNVNSKEKDKA